MKEKGPNSKRRAAPPPPSTGHWRAAVCWAVLFAPVMVVMFSKIFGQLYSSRMMPTVHYRVVCDS